MARKTCQYPITNGGLGIVDISVKVKALQLRFISQICDSNYSSPWVYFARYFIGLQPCKYLPLTSFLRNITFEVLFPILSAPNCTTKVIYSNIISSITDPLVSEFSWQISLGKDIEWRIPWLSSRLGLSTGFENDVLWKIYIEY